MQRSHHISLVGYFEQVKISPEESVQQYEITQIGIKDIQSNANPVCGLWYRIGYLSPLAMCVNSECALRYMQLCRILCNTHDPCPQVKDHFHI